jgi:methyl-accepting chemotaxis protein
VITETTSNAEQMSRAAEGIARGAQEQAVAKTGHGMETIRTRTTVATEKVKEMSTRSKEIGRIVETIDDIADKTDMLALNAAVEAARAGEHGRGFAVVADQVRKLSEDSKNATRDIGELIERVQDAVSEAIAAMENTADEVDSGTKQIDEAVSQLKEKSKEVLPTIDTVSAIVEENTASTEEMAANSQEITSNMEGAAGIAEENSASTEEVSASAEEMSAQVEEVVASAEELSALAEELNAAANQFRLAQAGGEQPEQTDQESDQATVPDNGRQSEPVPELEGYQDNGRSS